MKIDFLHQIVGTTTTGKKIPAALRNDEIQISTQHFQDTFTDEECFDAYCAFEYLTMRTMRIGSDERIFELQALSVSQHIGDVSLNNMKLSKGMKNIFDLIRYGRTLVNIEFRDL